MSLVCPECGAREDEIINGMFSGPEPAIRRQGEWAECKLCGNDWLIPSSLLTGTEK